jgi:hypothetical protein
VRLGVVAAYAVPAAIAWSVIGLALAALPLAGFALVAAVLYGGYYGLIELAGRRGLPPPGRRWQVPQTMMIDAPPRRRVLVWGAILGPGFLTRNPYAGFAILLLAVAAMPGLAAGLALGAAIGAAHGGARAVALLRDVRELHQAQGDGRAAPDPVGTGPVVTGPVVTGPVVTGPVVTGPVVTHLDLLLKTVYWRRIDGAALLAFAVTAAVAAVRYFT